MKEYIEKDLVMDALLHERYGYCCEDAINKIPAADVVEVRHAKDVYKQYTKHHCEFMCSLCGGWIGVIESGDCDFNYCPNCGAKMDGGVNDEAD